MKKKSMGLNNNKSDKFSEKKFFNFERLSEKIENFMDFFQ